MSRKFMLGLAIAALAGATIASGPASAARHTTISVTHRTPHPRPVHPTHPWHPGKFTKFHHHHRVFRHGRWIILDEPVVATVVPGPCTCLTKSYTPAGLVVFADLCTQESASAPVDGSVAEAVEGQDSNNYGGRTYQDYLATHPQTAQVQKAPAIPQPAAPDVQPKN
jgi:hypothetical protein